jgi:Zn finger protein HypA/HybF involved in hydrogenase expression
MITAWESKEDAEISFWHCGRPAYWENDDVYCSKCQSKMEDN